mgnify:FL=1
MVAQQIQGPLDRHIVGGAGFYRDTRRLDQIVWASLADPICAIFPLVLTALALFVPALFEIWLLVGIPYTCLVLMRTPVLPMRMPRFIRRRDPNYPDRGTGRPGKALGDWLMFVDRLTGQPGYLSTNDMRTHCIVAGTTGAGKTKTLLCKQANVVAQGSGFLQVDGKGSNSNFKDVAALTRKSGVGPCFRVVNFLTSSGSRESHTWNPFATLNSEAVKNLLITLFIAGDAGGKGGSSQFFVDRGMDLTTTVSELVVWARDARGIPVNLRTIRRVITDFDALRMLVVAPDGPDGLPRLEYWSSTAQAWKAEILTEERAADGTMVKPALPQDLRERVMNYMRETGGYSAEKAVGAQDKVREQHGYVVGGFGATFTQLSNSLGHIFDVDVGSIDMRDVIFNRRTFTAILPVLENDAKVNSRLGRFLINAIRYGLAPGVGGQLTGDIQEVIVNQISNAPTVYCADFDELGLYASEGAQAILAQARALNISTTLAFQEISSLIGALGKPAADALLSNPRLHFIMSLNDNTATQDWVTRSAPRVAVSVNASYQASATTGLYQDQGRADVREMPLFTWMDVTSQLSGQAIVTYYGRRVFAEVPNIELPDRGFLRLPAFLVQTKATPMTSSSEGTPTTLAARRLLEHADAVTHDDKTRLRGALRTLCTSYAAALQRNETPDVELTHVYEQLSSAFVPRLVSSRPPHANPPSDPGA